MQQVTAKPGTLQQQVTEEIAKYLGVSAQDVDPDATLLDDLGLGPVELSELLTVLSTRFKVTFSPEDVENLRTVDDVIATIEDLSLE